MISCLICASSILLVAGAYSESDGVSTVLQSQMLNDDAETCLKVFDVLSANSDAARRARDMMDALKRSRILTKRLFLFLIIFIIFCRLTVFQIAHR